MPKQPSAPPRSLGGKIADFFTSPQLVLMTLAGLLLIIGVPYLAFRSIPGAGELFAPQPAPVDANKGMDFTVLQTLPPDLADGVGQILASGEPQMPQSLFDLPAASGTGLVYPVMETVEPLQPALSWTDFGPPPYSVTVKNSANQVIARIESIPLQHWLVPMPLERGGRYTWTVKAGNQDTESASFIVMSEEAVAQWRDVQREFKDSHLVWGLVAEELGMLTVAEREYKALLKAFPEAEAPARLLTNAQGLRDDSIELQSPEVF